MFVIMPPVGIAACLTHQNNILVSWLTQHRKLVRTATNKVVTSLRNSIITAAPYRALWLY